MNFAPMRFFFFLCVEGSGVVCVLKSHYSKTWKELDIFFNAAGASGSVFTPQPQSQSEKLRRGDHSLGWGRKLLATGIPCLSFVIIFWLMAAQQRVSDVLPVNERRDNA